MAKTQYLDYAGLQELVTKIKAADTVVKNFAGDLTGKTDKDGKAYTSVQAYLEDEIAKAAKAGDAENVAVKDTAGHFTGTNVETVLAELAVAIELLNDTDATKAGTIAKMIADEVGELKIGATTYSTVKDYVDAMCVAVKKLFDATTGDLSNLKTTAKGDVVSAINELKDAYDGVDYSGKADKVASATAGNFAGLDSNGNLTDSGKKADDFVLATAVGTAAAKNVKTAAIADADAETATVNTDVVTAEQVVTYVKGKVAGVTGALHYRGIKTATSDITDPAEGDVVIVGTVEYIYDGSNWQELGNEGAFVTKTTTIAGVDLQDNITASELKTALGVDTLETTVGDATSGLVKDVAANKTAIGDSTSGLVKQVSDLEGLVGEGTEAIPVASVTALFA